MLRECSDLLRTEELHLAAYALRARLSRGRVHFEQAHPFRTDFQRDRDRILHSKAFRRLEYKTQVFLSGSGDHLRNRLTHTIEVAAISRTIARALAANEDLTEAIALAHDIGHPPFGHAGERALSKVMENFGGFDHNLQALRTVDLLEIKYPDYDGINLTYEVRSGLLKHREGIPALPDGSPLDPSPSLEAQIADLADDLTYYGHDVDDGLEFGLIREEMLEPLEIWQVASEKARAAGLPAPCERFSAYTVRCLIDAMVGDAIRNSACRIADLNPRTPEEVSRLSVHLISFSPQFERMTQELKQFLYQNLYFCKELQKLNALSLSRIQFLFDTFLQKPELMGDIARSRLEKDGPARAAADYIAGMTDNFAIMEYLRLHE